jgi:hypothetical protein
VQANQFFAESRNIVGKCLDEQQEFLRLFDLAFPAIDGLNRPNDVHACGELLFDQCGGNGACFVGAGDGGENYSLVSHSSSLFVLRSS